MTDESERGRDLADNPDPIDAYFPPVPPALAEHTRTPDGEPVDADHLEGLAALIRELDGWGYGGTVQRTGHHEVSFHDAQRIARYVTAAEAAWRGEREFRDSFLAATMAESVQARADLRRIQDEQGVTRSENARLRTAAGQMEEQSTAAQARCDAAQDAASEALAKAEEALASAARWREQALAGEGKLARAGRPAHTEVIRPAAAVPVDPEVIAQRVADLLVERAGPILGRIASGSVRLAQEGLGVAAQGLEAFRAPGDAPKDPGGAWG